MIVKSFIYFIILITPFFLQCKSVDKTTYKNINNLKGISSREIESRDKIDDGKTFELFFTLDNDEDCLMIDVSSEVYDIILNKNVRIKTFYIIEKSVDLSRFGPDKINVFSEIDRNYDYNWNAKQKIEICSSATDPIKIFKKNNNFRLRFTVFSDKNFKYEITISSEHRIIITEKNAEVK